MRTVRLSLMFWALTALAQFPFPGQGPAGYPGGSPGGNPPNQRRPQQQQPQQQQPQNSKQRSNRPATLTTEGMLRRVSGNQLVIEADDHRIIWYRITAQTASRKDDRSTDVASFQPGDRLSVDSSEDNDGNYTATGVEWERAGKPEERAAARETWDLPSSSQAASNPKSGRRDTVGDTGDDDRPILRRKNDDSAPPPSAPAPIPQQAPPAQRVPTQAAAQAPTSADDDPASTRPATQVRPVDAPSDADDPGRPVLRRGGAATARQPATSASGATSGSTSSPTANNPSNPNTPTMVGRSSDAASRPVVSQPSQPILPQEDPLIPKVRQAAYAYSASLPNFFCQQMTTRYGSQNPRQGWETLDVVTADVQYLDGQESYRNIKASGKSTVQSMEQLDGTRSSGEFSSLLQDLMSDATAAVFRRSGTDSIHGRNAIVFKLDIPRERSHWRIEAPSQLYYPAIRGTIWVDKETSRVLRIEIEARNLPGLFPFDTVESATDYDFIRLSAAEQEYLLPADAEVLNCERGSTACSRNRIEFRNYKKFDSATSITFGAN